MSGNDTNCFAIRRLSPFQGSLQVIEAQHAQASTSNGLDWRVQVRLPTPPGLDSDSSTNTEQIILFGFWSSEGGFHRVPLPPMLSSHQIEVAAQPVMDVLLELSHRVPFRQHDNCELWLLDEREQRPLVLIAAASDPQRLPHIRRPEWQPTLLTDHSFTRSWCKTSQDDPAWAAREAIAQLIKHTAGQNPQAHWVQRQADGTGRGLVGINLAEGLISQLRPAGDFPELLIRENWQTEDEQRLINDYIEWQAPFLLTLPTLSDLTRKRIEQLAFKQAFKVEGQHKLYPKVIDEERLKAVLIEAQMRRSNPEAGANN